MRKSEWILCPICGNKTRDKIREDTILKNYPHYCPKCKQEILIEVTNLTGLTEKAVYKRLERLRKKLEPIV